MTIVVLCIKCDHEIFFVPIGPTELLEPAYFLPPGPPFEEVVVHLCPCHFNICKLRQVPANSIQVEPLISLEALPYKVRKMA